MARLGKQEAKIAAQSLSQLRRFCHLINTDEVFGTDTGHKGSWFPGEHDSMVDPETFSQVQDLLKTNAAVRSGTRHDNRALLTGILFDDRGNRMSPSFTVKRGARYYCYVSTAVLRGRKSTAGSLTRIPAKEIETQVLESLRHISEGEFEENSIDNSAGVLEKVERIVVSATKIRITLKPETSGQRGPIEIKLKTFSTSTTLAKVQGADGEHNADPALIHAVIRAHVWIKQLSNGTFKSVEDLAQNARLHPKVVRNAIKMAFLAPDITHRILTGQMQTTLTARDIIRDVPMLWRPQ